MLTSPTVATIGMSITIPLAIISDFFINSKIPTDISILGAILVIIGFCLVNINKELEKDIIKYCKNLILYCYRSNGTNESVTRSSYSTVRSNE